MKYFATLLLVLVVGCGGKSVTPPVVNPPVTPNAALDAPTFTPTAGTYTTTQQVTISTTKAGAQIHYTVDGSAPTAASTLYTAPITVSATTTIRAMATLTNYPSSKVADSAYVIQPYFAIDGNYQIVATSASGAGFNIGASMQKVDIFSPLPSGDVKGILHIFDSPCYDRKDVIPFTGTVGTMGSVTITTAPIHDQVITLNGVIATTQPDPKVAPVSTITGSYTMTGCGGDSGTIDAYTVPQYTVEMFGVMSAADNKPVEFHANTAQMGPDNDGIYSMAGQFTFKGEGIPTVTDKDGKSVPCYSSGSVTNSFIIGTKIYFEVTTDRKGLLIFSGEYANADNTITGGYVVNDPSCLSNGGWAVSIK